MNASARLSTWCIAGALLLSAEPAVAQAPLRATLTAAALGQSGEAADVKPSRRFPVLPNLGLRKSEGAPADPYAGRSGENLLAGAHSDAKAKAANYLERGRAALQQGDQVGAIGWWRKAAEMNASFASGEYSPQDLADQLVQSGVDPGRLQPRAPADRRPLSPDQAAGRQDQHLPPIEQSNPLAGPNSEWVVDDPRQAAGGDQSRGGLLRLPPTAGDPVKAEALRLVAKARAALDAGDLAAARRFALSAQEMRIPDSAFESEETRPWQVVLEVDAAIRRAGGVEQAGAFADDENTNASGQYAVQPSVYDPEQDDSRNVAAQAQIPFAPGGPKPPGGMGKRHFDMGIQALANQDRQAAIRHFQEAWKHERELDPATRSQLKDKLSLLQMAAGAPGAGKTPTPLEAATAEQRLLRQSLVREITAERSEAEKLKASNPRAGLARLQAVRTKVVEADVDPDTRKNLLLMVDRGIGDIEKYMREHEAQIELDDQNREILEQIDQEHAGTIEVQGKLAELVDEFNRLMDEGRYPEAEVIAKQAREIAPESEVVQTLVWKSRFVRRMQEQNAIQEGSEEGTYGAITAVFESAQPFDDRDPIRFGDARRWAELSASRRRMMEQNSRHLTPAELEIQKSLDKQVQVSFVDRPLSEVMDVLGRMAGVNVYLDPQGLGAEGVTSDTPVTLNLPQPISLKSAMNLLLEPLHLSYVIQNEVLRITSEQTRSSDVYAEVYNVADLVIPIPNFVPNYYMGLPGAMREAYNTQANLGFGGGGMNSVPMTVAAGGGQAPANASVLAQMASSGMLGSAGSRTSQPVGYGPGGMGGGPQADFDSLIELMTTTIAPDTWDEVGGPGSVAPFETNLSLVVSQTQEVHEQIADLLEQLRRLQDLQVTIEVRFITLNDNFFERIGVDFDFDIDDNFGGITPEQLPDDGGPTIAIGLDPQTGAPTADLDLQFNQGSFGSAVPQFGGFDPTTAAQFGFAILSDIETFFVISAAQGDDRSNVLQAPKVTLFNGQQAFVSDTAQRPFVTSIIPVVGDFAAAHQPVITVLNEGTSLSVQAVVSSDRRFVRLTLVPFFSQIGEVEEFTFTGKRSSDSGTTVVDPTDPDGTVQDGAEEVVEGTTVQLPTFRFTTITTTVSVPDGGTVLLGGIKRLFEGRTERGVPLLSKLPYINRLFRNVGIGRETQSLMMMVTPRIIIQEEEEANQIGGGEIVP